jgi:hypothetical protein
VLSNVGVELRVSSNDWLGFTFRPWHRRLCQPFGHARLPARPCSTPARDNLGWQPQADELPRIGRARASTFVDDCASEHVVGDFR